MDGHSSAGEALLGMLAAHLDGDDIRLSDLWPSDLARLDEIMTIGIKNRLEAWLLAAANSRGIALVMALRDRLEIARQNIIIRNAIGLRTAQLVSDALAAEKIEACFFKGPMAQRTLYGTYFQRRATDIDVLVAPSDLSRSDGVLAKLGYVIAPECRSVWWRTFLKEQHYFSPSNNWAVIDLHTSVQQPGGPQPRRLSRFFETETQIIGSSRVKVPKLEYSLLISAISLYKALQHREPAGGHLMDLATALRRLPVETWKRVEQIANEQGLGRLTRFVIDTVQLLLGLNGHSTKIQHWTRQSLAHAVLGLSPLQAQRISRTRLHWSVSESLPHFIGQTVWSQLSEGTRIIFTNAQGTHKANPKPTPISID